MRTGGDLYAALAALERKGYHRHGETVLPWCVTAGREWVAATDGYALVAVNADLVPGGTTSNPAPMVVTGAVKYLSAAVTAPIVVASGALKQFAGAADESLPCLTCQDEREVTCEECDGEGEVECVCSSCDHQHEADCENCGGVGQVPCPTCREVNVRAFPVALCGGAVSRSLLARALQVVMPADDLMLVVETTASKGGADTFIIQPEDGAAWRIVLMGLRESAPRAWFDKPETWPQAVSTGAEHRKDS